MAKPASMERLHKLHSMLTESFIRRLEDDEEQKMYTDAATLSAMIKLLKDSEVSADPASTDGLAVMQSGLEDQVARMRKDRDDKKKAALALAEADLKAMHL